MPSNELQSQLLDRNPLPIAALGPGDAVRYANPALARMLGSTVQEICEGPWSRWLGPGAGRMRGAWEGHGPRMGSRGGRIWLRTEPGNLLPVELKMEILEEGGAVASFLPARKEDVAGQDNFDAAVAEALAVSQEPVVLLAEVDRFKGVLLSMGADDFGIELQSLISRVQERYDGEMVIERVADDELAILLPRCVSPVEAMLVASELSEGLSTAGSAQLSCSVGIAVAELDHTVPDLIREASLALDVARRQGGGCYHLFESQIDPERTERRREIERALWGAVPGDQLKLAWQPIVNLSTGEICGSESLLRWNHPRMGKIGPSEFIPVAEESGSIVALSGWSTRESLRQLAKWSEAGGLLAEAYISINLSGALFRMGDVPRELSQWLREFAVDPSRIQLEITERLAMDSPDAVRRLRQLGCRIALDDFGTGYSNLSLLAQLEIDCLKIDRSLVTRIDERSEARGLLEAALAMAQSLELDVIVEGVETDEERGVLLALGVKKAQGFLFARPMDAEELGRMAALESVDINP